MYPFKPALRLTLDDNGVYFKTNTEHVVKCEAATIGGQDAFDVRVSDTINGWAATDWAFNSNGHIKTMHIDRDVYLVERLAIETHPQYYV
jgi:hypothetical protein